MPSNDVGIDSIASRVASLNLESGLSPGVAIKNDSVKALSCGDPDVLVYSVPIDGIVSYYNKSNNICYVLETTPGSNDAVFYKIDSSSKDINIRRNTKQVLHACSKIKIISSVADSKKTCKLLNMHILGCRKVVDFEIIKDTKHVEETMAVWKVKASSISCINNRLTSPHTVHMDSTKGVKQADLVIGQIEQLPPFFKEEVLRDGSSFFTKDFAAEKLFRDQLASHLSNAVLYEKPRLPPSPLVVISARRLTTEERGYIESFGLTIPGELTLEQAERYICEPLVAASKLEEYQKRLNIEKHTVQAEFKLKRLGYAYSITVSLDALQTQNCIKNVSTESWRVGSELVFDHPSFRKLATKTEAYVVVENLQTDSRNTTVVTLAAMNRSNDLFAILFKWVKNEKLSEGLCTLGPVNSPDSVTSLVSGRFPDFFKRRALFDAWCGRSSLSAASSASPPIARSNKTFKIKGRALDPSQLASMLTAANTQGFTCIAAPPGSGKTFTISALVATRSLDITERREDGKKVKVPARFVISSTTNVAVTNAIEAVHKNFPDLTICRKYSQQLEAQLSEESAKLSIRRMAKKAMTLRTSTKRMKNAIMRLRKSQNIKVKDLGSASARLRSIQESEKAITSAYLDMYDPLVYGSTAALIALNRNERATHLILDEAAQISPITALAIYTALPNLTHITLLGDSQQLGPHCTLEGDGLAKSLLSIGELTRLQKLSTVTQQRFNTVYRCHPTIVDIWLRPIYGKDLVAGVTATDRNLAASKQLPVAKNGAPCLLVNLTDSVCEDGRNKMEVDTALKLIGHLERKGVKGEDVVVITHHRAQRECLMQRLKGTGSIGPLKQAVGVYTIDSFQGKEAKVVIVLTTKTLHSDHMSSKAVKGLFSFVSNVNRETVAVSRAQHAMYILGDWSGLAQTDFWSQFGKKMIDAGAIVDSDFKPFLPPDSPSRSRHISAKVGAAVAKLQREKRKRNRSGRGRQ